MGDCPGVPLVLFSAHAEVFPDCGRFDHMCGALLRARGGISNTQPSFLIDGDSSPRTRRYFRGERGPNHGGVLFSAHAEVFPAMRSAVVGSMSLLRARGGISGG